MTYFQKEKSISPKEHLIPGESQDRETEEILSKVKECNESDISKQDMNKHSTLVSQIERDFDKEQLLDKKRRHVKASWKNENVSKIQLNRQVVQDEMIKGAAATGQIHENLKTEK